MERIEKKIILENIREYNNTTLIATVSFMQILIEIFVFIERYTTVLERTLFPLTEVAFYFHSPHNSRNLLDNTNLLSPEESNAWFPIPRAVDAGSDGKGNSRQQELKALFKRPLR